MTAFRTAHTVLFVLLVLGTGGCLTLSPAPRAYLLSAAPPASDPPPRANVAVGVGPVALPAYLDRLPIVVRAGADEITLSSEHHWAEPLRDGVPRTLAEDLSTRIPSDAVVVFPWRTPTRVQYRVTVDILRLDGALGGSAVLDARWRLLDAAGKELALRRVHFQDATEASYAALVNTHSRLLGRLSEDIAIELRSRLR
jgi:uncharacterized protein